MVDISTTDDLGALSAYLINLRTEFLMYNVGRIKFQNP